MVARKTIRNTPRIVDFIFEIPEGLQDVAYDDEFNDADDEDLNDDGSDEEDEAPPTEKPKKKNNKKKNKKKKKKKKDKKDNKDKDDHTDFPRSLRVVKQVIRTKKDGSQVVDLTVDVQRIGGADKYEFKITKKDTGQTTVING